MSQVEYQAAQNAAASHGNRKIADGCGKCHDDGNWIHVRYEYTDKTPVTDAVYVVQKPNGGETGGDVIAEGVLSVTEDSPHNYIHVDLGDYQGDVEVFFFDDPKEPEPFEEPNPVKDTRNWLQKAADATVESLSDAAKWTGGVLAGDFNQNMSTAQIITNAIVTAVPVIDQVADARDLVANAKLMIWDKRYNEIGVWVGVFACLIGLIPSLGSLAKGVIKLIWRNVSEIGRILVFINKALHKTGMKVNGYRWLKSLADEVVNQVGFVAKKFDEYLSDLAEKIKLADRFAPDTVAALLKRIDTVRGMANEKFAQVGSALQRRILQGLSDFATRVIPVKLKHSVAVRRAAEVVTDSVLYPKWATRMFRKNFDKEPLELGAKNIDDKAKRFFDNIDKDVVRWRDELLTDPYLPSFLREAVEKNPKQFLRKLKTFGAKPSYVTFKPGDKLYRVIGEEKDYPGGFWSRTKPPKSEAEWRSRDAILNDWNRGGAYVVAEFPPPPAAWVGPIAPQDLGTLRGDKFEGKMLEGGGEQVWIPTYPAVSQDQVKGFQYTQWNSPNDAIHVIRAARKLIRPEEECDQ